MSGLNDVRPANRTIMLGLKVRFDALVVESVHARQPTQHLAVFKFTQTYDALLFPTSASTRCKYLRAGQLGLLCFCERHNDVFHVAEAKLVKRMHPRPNPASKATTKATAAASATTTTPTGAATATASATTPSAAAAAAASRRVHVCKHLCHRKWHPPTTLLLLLLLLQPLLQPLMHPLLHPLLLQLILLLETPRHGFVCCLLDPLLLLPSHAVVLKTALFLTLICTLLLLLC